MDKSNKSKLISNIRLSLTKHSPEILTGIGLAGMVGSTIMAVTATPKALRLLEEKRNETHSEKLTPVEVVTTTWKCYIPAAVTGLTSAACLIKANSIHTRRSAALATAYNLSRTALSEYKEKVVETIGEKKGQMVNDQIAKDKLDKNPVSNSEVIITEKGNTLCYDGVFGRYFRSDMDTIKRAINKINRDMLTGDNYVSLNYFYSELGLSPVEIGYDLGWNVDDGTIEAEFSTQLADDGTPCLVVSYNVAPRYDYQRYF